MNRDPRISIPDFDLSQKEILALRCGTLIAGAISLVLGIITFILFLRMKRSFRHDLVMLLVQADTFEALWCVVFPLVSFSRGTVYSGSAFCQVSGFFLAFGIQTSDYAALLIAVHTGLYVFRGRDGLYPFRVFSFSSWFVFGAVFAALPFVNDAGYINRSEICYLPYDPDWVRRAFSWIPRYIIFGSIIIIYVSIYFYVIFLMKNKPHWSSSSGSRSGSGSGMCRRIRSSNGAARPRPGEEWPPPLPLISDHGLLEAQTPMDDMTANRQGLSGPSSQPAMDKVQKRHPASPDPAFLADRHAEHTGFSIEHLSPVTSGRGTFASDATPETLVSSPKQQHDVPQSPREQAGSRALPGNSGTASDATAVERPSDPSPGPWWKELIASLACCVSTSVSKAKASKPGFFFKLRGSHGSSTDAQSPNNTQHPNRLTFRQKARRQVRYMFIYPLAYMALWLIPFISQLLQSDGLEGSPFAILFLAQVSICFQGALDSIIFLAWEKPWRHVNTRRTFKIRKVRSHVRIGHRVGRTREEMHVDRINAIQRRNEELAERERQFVGRNVSTMDWWDRLDAAEDSANETWLMAPRLAGGGAMSTVNNLETQWSNPAGISAILMLAGGDIVQKAFCQGTGKFYTPVCLSFGCFAYALTALGSMVNDGRLLPQPDYPAKVINLDSGYGRDNKSWVIGRLLRDIEAKASRTKPLGDDGIRISVFEALVNTNGPAEFSWNLLHLCGLIFTVIQLCVAAIPLILDRDWSIMLITAAGTLLIQLLGALPQWKAEKLPNRQRSRAAYAITSGNGSRDIVVILGRGNCLDLEELSTSQSPRTSRPWEKFRWLSTNKTDARGMAHLERQNTQLRKSRDVYGTPVGFWISSATCVFTFILWLLVLVNMAAPSDHCWYMIAVGAIGMVQNTVAAGMEIKPKQRNLPLHLIDTIKRRKVMDGIMDFEVTYHCGQPLLEEFFPSRLRPDELKWWCGDHEPYDKERRAQKESRGVSRRERPSYRPTSNFVEKRLSWIDLGQSEQEKTVMWRRGSSLREQSMMRESSEQLRAEMESKVPYPKAMQSRFGPSPSSTPEMHQTSVGGVSSVTRAIESKTGVSGYPRIPQEGPKSPNVNIDGGTSANSRGRELDASTLRAAREATTPPAWTM
ncbi:G protein-coupled receptor GPR1 [Paramyrothecium foliicola]|nr:G protein-coupled receptor GPR1 [Paramyrothecium foliicola]